MLGFLVLYCPLLSLHGSLFFLLMTSDVGVPQAQSSGLLFLSSTHSLADLRQFLWIKMLQALQESKLGPHPLRS
jgi:hypothetical protein